MLVEAGRYQLVFSNEGHLQNITCAEQSFHLFGCLWKLETVVDGEHYQIENDGFVLETEPSENGCRLRWTKGEMTVEVSAFEKDGLLHMIPEVRGVSGLFAVLFPYFESIEEWDKTVPENNMMLVPCQGGFRVNNPFDTLVNRPKHTGGWYEQAYDGYISSYPCPLNFQFFTYYCGNEGYYWAEHDPNACFKRTAMCRGAAERSFDFTVYNYPENSGYTDRYDQGYPFVLCRLNGGWHQAVDIYREFAVQQKWCKVRNDQGGLNPQLEEIDLIRINHNETRFGEEFEEYARTAEWLRDRLDVQLLLHWYNWGMEEHDCNYPDYIARENLTSHTPVLKAMNERLTAGRIRKIPYVNARLWDASREHWETEQAAQWAIRNEQGETFEEPWNKPKAELRPLCPGTAFWQEKMASLLEFYYHTFGFDGVYIDQVGSFDAMMCFSRDHGHPVGGGRWWVDGYRKMLADIRQRTSPQALLTTESCCECYSDTFDLCLSLELNFQHIDYFNNASSWRDSVPLYSMIYGDYGNTYGSALSFTMPYDRYEFILMRNTLWGVIPTIAADREAVLTDATKQPYLDAIEHCVAFYREHRHTILYGHLIRLPQVVCDHTASVSWDVLFRQTGTYTVTFPSLCVSVWECEGHQTLLGYNFADETVTAEVEGRTLVVPPHRFISLDLN